MFEVLAFLYENSGTLQNFGDEDALGRHLAEAGFDDAAIRRAFDWLRDLGQVVRSMDTAAEATAGSVRVFTAAEMRKLGTQGAGFMVFLDAAGQISPSQREVIIDRALALPEPQLGIYALKVIVLMVLWSQQTDIDLLVLEELLNDDDDPPLVH